MSCDKQDGTWERIEFVAFSEAYLYADCLAGRRAEVLELAHRSRWTLESHFFQAIYQVDGFKWISQNETASTRRSCVPEHVPNAVLLEEATDLVDHSVSFSQRELRF